MSIIYMEHSSFEQITERDIRDIIDDTLGEARYAGLERYYRGQHDILNSRKRDLTAPNNKIVNNMAKYITDTAVGYFLGKPVIYNSQNESHLQAIQDIFDYNDEQDENMELAKLGSIAGACYEMLYLDEDGQVRFAKINPATARLIYASDSQTLLGAVRTIRSKD